MKEQLIAVIDLGKSNSKVALVDAARAEEIEVRKQASTILDNQYYPAIDHRSIETFVRETLQDFDGQYGIDALTVTTHGATVALVDAQAELVLPVLDYEFSGVDELAGDYAGVRPPFSETGSPRLPGGLNVGAQLYWQSHRYQEAFSQCTAILTWPQYWVNWLCGDLHNDLSSLGCHTDLYAPAYRRYSSLISRMGWSDRFPPTRPSGQHCGYLNSEHLPNPKHKTRVEVYTGIHDSNASLVPYLLSQTEPFSVVSTGTWFISMAVGGNQVKLDERRDTLFNVNARGQAVPSARFMGGREHELLAVDGIDGQNVAQKLLSNPHNVNAFLLPSQVNGTGPFPDCQSCWINEPDNDSALRSILVTLYLSLMTAECLSLIGSQGPVFVEGPLASDSLYLQMLSSATTCTVISSAGETGTSIGAAMLVSRPKEPPRYDKVTVEPGFRAILEDYARAWREQLQEHLRRQAQGI